MNVGNILLKIKEEVNKLDSSDFDNFHCWQIREAYNKAQLEFVRRRKLGKNQLQAGDEETVDAVDDLQVLLTPMKMNGKNKQGLFESEKLPLNYLNLKRVRVIASKGPCRDVKIKSHLREEANVDDYLDDWSMEPSFDFRETFHTLVGNKIRVYTEDDFEVQYLEVLYYRMPKEINFQGCKNIDGSTGTNVDPELKDDVVEIIISNAASILAGRTDNYNQAKSQQERSEYNT